MSAHAPRIRRLVRSADGSSQPWHCLLDDDTPWLVKFSGAGPGFDALVAEHVANGLGRLWGLPIPESKPVLLEPSLPRAGTDEFWDVLARSVGWNLAVRVIPGAVSLVPTADLPRDGLRRMMAYDTVLANWDRTPISRNLMRDEAGRTWWIDHGSCRFLHDLHSRRPPALPSNHFLFSLRGELEPDALRPLEPSRVEDHVATLPAEWLTAAGTDRERLSRELVDYLDYALA